MEDARMMVHPSNVRKLVERLVANDDNFVFRNSNGISFELWAERTSCSCCAHSHVVVRCGYDIDPDDPFDPVRAVLADSRPGAAVIEACFVQMVRDDSEEEDIFTLTQRLEQCLATKICCCGTRFIKDDDAVCYHCLFAMECDWHEAQMNECPLCTSTEVLPEQFSTLTCCGKRCCARCFRRVSACPFCRAPK